MESNQIAMGTNMATPHGKSRTHSTHNKPCFLCNVSLLLANVVCDSFGTNTYIGREHLSEENRRMHPSLGAPLVLGFG